MLVVRLTCPPRRSISHSDSCSKQSSDPGGLGGGAEDCCIYKAAQSLHWLYWFNCFRNGLRRCWEVIEGWLYHYWNFINARADIRGRTHRPMAGRLVASQTFSLSLALRPGICRSDALSVNPTASGLIAITFATDSPCPPSGLIVFAWNFGELFTPSVEVPFIFHIDSATRLRGMNNWTISIKKLTAALEKEKRKSSRRKRGKEKKELGSKVKDDSKSAIR